MKCAGQTQSKGKHEKREGKLLAYKKRKVR